MPDLVSWYFKDHAGTTLRVHVDLYITSWLMQQGPLCFTMCKGTADARLVTTSDTQQKQSIAK